MLEKSTAVRSLVLASLCTFTLLSCREAPPEHKPAPVAVQLPAQPPAPPATPENKPLPKVRIGILPFLDWATLDQDFSPLKEYLASAAGVDAEINLAFDYGALLSKLSSGELDVAVLSAYLYVKTKDKMGDALKVFAHTMTRSDDFYAGVIIVKADSKIGSLTQLKGKRFAYVDKNSSSGYIFPRLLLRDNKIDPDKFFGKTSFEGGHDKVVNAVIDGKADAGAVWDDIIKAVGAERAQLVKVIAKTLPIQPDAVCLRTALGADLSKRVEDAFLAGDKTKLTPMFEKMRIKGWKAASDADYDGLREKLRQFPQE